MYLSPTGTVRRLCHKKSYDSTAPGRRQEESYDFWSFLDIVRCPVKFRHCFKFHGARTAFGRVIEGKKNIGRAPYGARPAFAHIGRAPDDFCLKFKSYDSNSARPGIVRCLTSARNFQKSFIKSADARPGTGRYPSGRRPMWYESNSHRWEVMCFRRSTYCIYIDIPFLKIKT